MEKTMHGKVTQLTVLQRIEPSDKAQHCSLAKRSCILLVTANSQLEPSVMEYTINVADRMNCKVLAAYVHTLPHFWQGGTQQDLFTASIERNGAAFREKAAARGVEFEFVQDSGRISRVISRLCRIVKRVEFVLIDQGIRIEETASASPVPVFNIVCTDARSGRVIPNHQTKKLLKGEKHMKATSRKSHFLKTILFGAMTAVFYAAVFSNSDFIMKYFTRGGLFALLPVATVFAFSYAHGSFTSNFWSALGIEGSKGAVLKQRKTVEKRSEERRPDTRPRLRADA